MVTLTKIEKPSLHKKNVLLVTSQANSYRWRAHYKRHHPPDTLMIYAQACQAISSEVFILPVDEFLSPTTEQKFANSEGIIVNISGGLTDVGLTSIIPCIATHLGLPVFPAGTKSLVTTHDKLLCKYLALNCGLRTARTLPIDEAIAFKEMLIQKPISGGDSIGITAHKNGATLTKVKEGYFIEEFIHGFDATIHLVRNTKRKEYQILDHLVSGYGGTDWFDLASKNESNRIFRSPRETANRQRFSLGISRELKQAIDNLLHVCGSPFVARVDFRQLTKEREIGVNDCVFLEINVAPTISHANNWQEGLIDHFSEDVLLQELNALPIHPAAKSLGYLISKFYDQSLSIAGNNPVRDVSFPKCPPI